MPTSFVHGDLFNTPKVRAYAQGVGCAGSMDAGVAIAFKKRWPRMFEDYKARCEDGRFHLGDVHVWSEARGAQQSVASGASGVRTPDQDANETVFNLGIQEHWKKKATLPALNRALAKMLTLATAAGVTTIGMPRIGAGLGGLEWRRVKDILTELGDTTDIALVVFEKFVREPS
jgi:O-acetyl-ADP-ribose deacetylase (regulator of RNase III)